MYKAPGYRTDGLRSVSASCFGDHITADHVVIYRDSDNMVEDVRLALVIKDAATSFMFAYPSALKDADECKAALQHFVSSTDKVGVFYSDNAKELTKASKPLGSRHEHSKDYIHQSNACNFRGHTLQSFGSRSFPWYWPQALEHACAAFNISHPNGIEHSPWYKGLEKVSRVSSCLLDAELTIGLDPSHRERSVLDSNQPPSQAYSSVITFNPA